MPPAKTCTRFYNLISPVIFKHDIRQHYASSLHLSVKRNKIEGVAASLRHGADINQPDRSLMHIEEKMLSDHRFPDLGTPVETSLTALHWASLYGCTDLVHYLLESGADVHQRADMGFYHFFSHESYSLEKLETNGDDPHRVLFSVTIAEYISNLGRHGMGNVSDPLPLPMRANSLFFALKGSFSRANRCKWESAYVHPGQRNELYLDTFVDDDTTGSRLKIVKALIKAGSSLLTRERGKVHALHQACAYRDVEVARFLLEEMEVDPNTRDSKGDTSLHYVAASNYEFDPRTQKIVNLLIDKGAKVDAQNADGQSPADIGLYTEYK
ncbi:ankyrin repeat protein [Colletotrichum scovillei]|uniref:Ankyrin repeat protein n=2 Tax=Colletotrichum scovillei TaxID=1209932 RepID=A0A9P7QQQ8_9PEZI|nr:ankyrin repeat protein [Colletotrichum scovillei]